MDIYIAHAGYFLGTVGVMIRDVLWLRLSLLAGHLLLVVFYYREPNKSILFWYSLFSCVNLFQIVKLWHERRPVELPEDISDLHTKLFHSMSQREFLYFWELGIKKSYKSEIIIREGEHPKHLMLLLSGVARVDKSGTIVAQLNRGSFVAEMSFLTHEPASANVLAEQEVTVICWNQEKLRALETLNMSLFIKLQKILGRDMAVKVKSKA